MARCETCGHWGSSKRSLAQNKLMWDYLRFLWFHARCENFKTAYQMHNSIKIGIGHVEEAYDITNDRWIVIPKPTDFSNMKQEEFNDYLDRARPFIWEKIITPLGEDFQREVKARYGAFV